MRAASELEHVLALLGEGLTATEVARATKIPRSTVRDWGYGRGMRQSRRSDCSKHDFSSLDGHSYAYLLGMYLGDGCISASAMSAVAPGKRAHVLSRRSGRCVDVSSYWKHWPCYFPQHGQGRKHTRPIVLTDWQLRIVEACVESLLRGLIHSDGTRIVATERKGRYVRHAPRYAFSNRSEDILGIFRTGCEIAGIHCTRASEKQIAVYSKSAVARLDEFVGPKG